MSSKGLQTIIAIFLLSPIAGFSQIHPGHVSEEPEFDTVIYTDRPDQTEAPQLTPKGWVQIETGFQRENDNNKETSESAENILYNSTLWKYGISKRFEVRLITEYAGNKIRYNKPGYPHDSTSSTSGLNAVKVGSKIFIQNQKGLIPQIGFISHLTLPYFGAEAYKPQHLLPDFRFTFAHEPNRFIIISYNLGAEWNDDLDGATAVYTAEAIISPTHKLSIFLEAYGFLKENDRADHRMDWGILYLVTNNFQLDCSAGVGLTDNAPDYFISAGISFRMNVADRSHKR